VAPAMAIAADELIMGAHHNTLMLNIIDEE
jgi:hypothetical protein